MKRGTPEHPKVAHLASILNINHAWAMGILEALWHFTARYAPQGDIGKHTDSVIAKAVYWERPTGERGVTPECKLSGALVTAKWLDPSPIYRLIVHDWRDHADEAVRKFLSRHGLDFVSTQSCLPEPLPKPEPLPARGFTNGEPEFTEAMALKWLRDAQKNGADYNEGEMRKAFLGCKSNGWKWGGADKRAALERQILWDRDHQPTAKTEGIPMTKEEILREAT